MTLAAIAAVLLIATSPASAKPKHHKTAAPQTIIVCTLHGCSDNVVTSTSRVSRTVTRYVDDAVSYLPHPPGCPRVAFCAGGAAVDLWGGNCRDYRNLWQARAWYKFPRSHSPMAGDVAVRQHHVFVLRSHIEGDIWMTADYNSGGHKSRLHAQSIRGYVIVSPSRQHVAQLN